MSKVIYKIGKVETDEDDVSGVLIRYPNSSGVVLEIVSIINTNTFSLIEVRFI